MARPFGSKNKKTLATKTRSRVSYKTMYTELNNSYKTSVYELQKELEKYRTLATILANHITEQQ